MKNITRLIMKAKQRISPLKLSLVMVELKKNKLKVVSHLWNGRGGHLSATGRLTSVHNAYAEALQKIQRMEKAYPNEDSTTIIIDDIPNETFSSNKLKRFV